MIFKYLVQNYLAKIFTLSIFLLCGCNSRDFTDCFKSAGADSELRRELGAFRSIVVEDKIDLVLVPDSGVYAEIKGPKNLLAHLTTEIKDGILTIHDDNRCEFVRSLNIRPQVELHYDPASLETIESSAVAALSGTLKCKKVVLSTESAGDVRLKIDASDMLELHLLGSGDAFLEGFTPIFVTTLADAGTCDARMLDSPYTYIFHDGARDVVVRPEKELGVKIGSVGNVYYTQEPWKISRYPGKGTGRLIKTQ